MFSMSVNILAVSECMSSDRHIGKNLKSTLAAQLNVQEDSVRKETAGREMPKRDDLTSGSLGDLRPSSVHSPFLTR